MPDTPDLTEDQKAALIRTGAFFHNAARDPKIRRTLFGVIKEVNPDQPIPEYDLETGLDERIKARVDPVLEENKRLVTKVEALEGQLNRRGFQERHNLDDAELADVEETAKQYGITNGDKAVEFWRDRERFGTPRATPLAAGDGDYLDKVRKNAGNPRALKELATQQATKVLRELRGGRVR